MFRARLSLSVNHRFSSMDVRAKIQDDEREGGGGGEVRE